MLAGSMMIPDPIMLTATIVVRPIRVIFLLVSAMLATPRQIMLPAAPSALARLQALQPIGSFVVLDAVGVVTESGEQAIDRLERLQVAEDRAVRRADLFAGHQQRNPRRVGHD